MVVRGFCGCRDNIKKNVYVCIWNICCKWVLMFMCVGALESPNRLCSAYCLDDQGKVFMARTIHIEVSILRMPIYANWNRVASCDL